MKVTKKQLQEMIKGILQEQIRTQPGHPPPDRSHDPSDVKKQDFDYTLHLLIRAKDQARNLAMTRRGGPKGKIYQAIATQLIQIIRTLKATGP